MKRFVLMVITLISKICFSADVYISEPSIKDVSEIGQLNIELGYILDEEETTRKINLFLDSDLNKLWVAKVNDKIVGFIAINIVEPFNVRGKFTRVDSFVVSQQCRNMGVGKKLIEFVEEHSKKIGSTKVFLSCNNRRIESHKFYEKMGYASNSKYFFKCLNT